VLSKIIDIVISYPFSATKRAMAKRLLASKF